MNNDLVFMRGAKDERELEYVLHAVDLADLEELLRQPWGRRLYYRVVFKLGRLDSASFDFSQDGMRSALLTARNEGIREVAQVLASEAQLQFPDLWTLMLQERVAAAAEEARLREQARASSRENDE